MQHSQFAENTAINKQKFLVSDYLQPELVQCKATVASQKRLFEVLSEIVATYLASQFDSTSKQAASLPNQEKIFYSLHERERLGSTALGKGVALPHSRVEGLINPIISVIRLDEPLQYDSPDDYPVWLIACLLVPVASCDSHLHILSGLEQKFDQHMFLNCAKNAKSNQQIYDLFVR